jgi:hypothetical protein
MGVAPVSYIVIEFPGNQFRGEIAPALDDLVERGIVRVLDLVFALRDETGELTVMELSQLPDEATQSLARFVPPSPGLLNEEDIALLGETIPTNSSAGLLVLEHLWAKPFSEAVANAGGHWLLMEGVPPDVLNEALAALPA